MGSVQQRLVAVLLGLLAAARLTDGLRPSSLGNRHTPRAHTRCYDVKAAEVTANADADAEPPKPQFDGYRGDDGKWYDSVGPRNGPPVNYWRSSQRKKLEEKHAALLQGDGSSVVGRGYWWRAPSVVRSPASNTTTSFYTCTLTSR